TVVSDSEDSTVTYKEVSSPFTDLSDIGSPGVDGPPVMPEDPYAYMVATFQAPHISAMCWPELRELSHACAILTTAVFAGFVPESDLRRIPEEDDDEDPEEDPADYPTDGGDDDNNKDESSDDDEDNDVDIEEEDEHLAPADSTAVALPAVDHAPSAEETEPFETDESAATPPPHPHNLAIPTPPPSPLFPWSSPLPQIPSPPLPVSPLPLPVSPTYPLGYRAAMIRLRAEAPSTSHSPPPHIILSHIRADTPPSGLGIALGLRYEVGESSSAPTARPPGGAPATDETELGRRMTNFVTNVRHDTYEIYVRLDDKQTKRQLMAGRLNMLYRDRRVHARTSLLMEKESRMSREAWG
ncbi:hypothetical protein Tco_0808545, partial [Tanacetum coccineum]